MSLEITALKRLMGEAGVEMLLMKQLAPNDNSKNQPYFGPDLNELSFLPIGTVRGTPTKSDKPKKSQVKFLVDLDFAWINDDGVLFEAPQAKLIYYPQYPEVRFSGFLQGCHGAPCELMDPKRRGREQGRVLFLGIAADKKIVGYLADRESPAAKAVAGLVDAQPLGVFDQLPLGYATGVADTKSELLHELCRISQLEWVDSKRLLADGTEVPYLAPNGAGYTLEAELGITPNGYSEPDFLGWEVKQYRVGNIELLSGGRITLMTPEPTGGVYKDAGVEEFLMRYGYPDTKGRDRRNFCGIHKVGERHPRTGLSMHLAGYDADKGVITDSSAGITLLDDHDNVAAVWHYAGIVDNWKRKHAKAVYVPSTICRDSGVQYKYSNRVSLGVGANVSRLLSAIADNTIVYDPGVIMKNAETTKRPIKRRSQFRIPAGKLSGLYETFDLVDACGATERDATELDF